MNKLKDFVLDNKKIILIIIAVIVVLGACLSFFIKEDDTTKTITKGELNKEYVLSIDKKWGVKKLESSKKYTVQQWNEGTSIVNNYYVYNKKYSDCHAYFSIDKKNDSIEKLLKNNVDKKYNQKYVSIKHKNTMFYDFESKNKEKDYLEKEHFGYFEKDGSVFEYKYQRYSDIKEDILLSLINEVLNNIYIEK